MIEGMHFQIILELLGQLADQLARLLEPIGLFYIVDYQSRLQLGDLLGQPV